MVDADLSLNEEIDDVKKHELILYKLEGYLGISKYDLVIELSQIIVNQKVTGKKYRMIFLASLFEAEAYRFKQNYERALIIYDKLKKLITKHSGIIYSDKTILLAKFNFFKGKLCHSKGDILDSIILFEEAIELFSNLNDKIQRQQTMVELASAYRDNNDSEKSKKLCMQALAIKNVEESSITVSKCLYLLGLIAEDVNNYSMALSYYNQSLNIVESNGSILNVAQTLHSIGIIQQQLGLFEDSISRFEESYNIVQELNNKYEMSKLQNSLGIVFIKLGNYNKSLKHFKHALQISNELDNKHFLARDYYSLSKYYLIKNNLETSIEYIKQNTDNSHSLTDVTNGKSYYHLAIIYYIQNESIKSKQCLDQAKIYFKKIKDYLLLSKVFLFEILIFDDKNKSEYQRKCLANIEEIVKIENNKQIEVLYRFANVILSKNSIRLYNKALALKYFNTISKDNLIDTSFKEYALLQVIKLSIFNYNLYSNQSTINEIKEAIILLKEYAESNYQFRLKIYSCMLQSKLSLLQNNVDNAIGYIEEAFLISQTYQFSELQEKLSIEYEQLSNKVSYWRNYLKRKKINKKILNKVGLEKLVEEILNNKIVFYN